jgi:isocitrate dehydrogenase
MSHNKNLQTPDIIYTIVDEAPALASSSWLPVIQAYCSQAGINIQTKDISLASRIIAQFSNSLTTEQKQSDDLAWLGELVKQPEANVIKLPNISASIPQIKAAISELQQQGYNIPDFPEQPKNDSEKEIANKYLTVKGSAVNPVLRQGNSDRRVAKAVKKYAQNNPHSMGQWNNDSKTNVAHLDEDDFYGNEKSCTISEKQSGKAKIVLCEENGNTTTLKDNIDLEINDIVDTTYMCNAKLRTLIKNSMDQAKQQNILLSLHLKATMMKVSDPIIFGQAVKVYFEDIFTKHNETFKKLGINVNNGLGDITTKIKSLPEQQQTEILQDIKTCLDKGPDLAMVDSDKGITNLHVPSDIIVDASMASLMRNGGRMWGPDGKEQDTLAIIPDRCYAGIYQAAIDFCREHGAFDPATMGTVDNVGLMAQKAEEYGSHDKTFLASADATIKIITANGDEILKQKVSKDDIVRCCIVKDIAILDWIKLAVNRAERSKTPVVFWLDEKRAHDAELIKKINSVLPTLNTAGLDIKISAPNDAMLYTLKRAKAGENTISATGNVLRDYLTDLFPILELGTSAKMLSIVPLLNGGGLFETGAGGSAPKHVQQFYQQGHLRWDSLGEFMALAESLAHYARTNNNAKAEILAQTLECATSKLLDNNKSPGRKVGQLGNAGSHAYQAMYWAEELSKQTKDEQLQHIFTPIYKQLSENIDNIIAELSEAEDKTVNCGGYYHPDKTSVDVAMRPSKTFNNIIDHLEK